MINEDMKNDVSKLWADSDPKYFNTEKPEYYKDKYYEILKQHEELLTMVSKYKSIIKEFINLL